MKLGFPRVEVFSRIRIDGLIITAMELRVADGVANQAAADTRMHRPGCPHHDRLRCRHFVDSGQLRLRARIRVRPNTSQVDRQHMRHPHRVALTRVGPRQPARRNGHSSPRARAS
ncbi:Uncharacterised protein [Mycobacterium tuberculosis]|uniref:Uncharacterized protein n=1 Tax=Mycobacterium tuberculosis TaxID=1773 RepID=A0A916L7N8_MYCTX|nr:Uncharacterised protein [Mycobacterium tuberculosis]